MTRILDRVRDWVQAQTGWSPFWSAFWTGAAAACVLNVPVVVTALVVRLAHDG